MNINKTNIKHMNTEVNVPIEWDEITIQITKEGGPCGAIRMMKKDMQAIMELHNQGRNEILEMLLATIETEPLVIK